MTEPAAPPVVEKDGQVLRHTTAAESRKRKRRIVAPRPPPPEPPPEDEDEGAAEDGDGEEDAGHPMMRKIVARHSNGDGSEPGDGDEPPVEAEVPEVQFVSASGEDMPPPMDPRPELRDEMSMDEPELVTVPQPPRTFEDLMAFDLGDRYHVHVVRKEPKAHGGTRCDGEQKPIKRKMQPEEFARTYGGLKYELTLYGPPKRGAQFDPMSGLPITRALTKPITVTMPGSPPNLQMAIGYNEDDGEEEDMTQDAGAAGYVRNRTRPGIANNADARIHETDLEHERHMEEKREQRRREMDARRRENEAERQRVEVSSADAMARMHETSMESQRDIYKHMSTQQNSLVQQLASGRPGAGAEEQRYLHEAIKQLQSTHQDYINKLNENHAAALERTQDAHRTELARLDTQHRAELQRAQDQVVAERTRSDQIARDAERVYNDRARDAETRAAKEVADVRRETSERIDALRRDYETRRDEDRARQADRYQDIKDAHERELRGRDAKWESQLASERAGHDSKMAVKDHELQQLRDDNARLREENAKPIHERVREITETAEALGIRKADGSDAEPDTWQTMLFRMGGDIVQNLPQIISSAGESVARLRQGGTPAQQAAYVRQQQVAMGAAAASHPVASAMPSGPLPFALEGEDDFQPLTAAPLAYPPTYQPAEPAAAPQQPLFQAAPGEPQPQPPASAAPISAAPAAPSQSQPPPAPAPIPAAVPDPAMDPYILQYREPFEQAMATGVKPNDLAAHLSKTFPAPVMAQVVEMISPQIIRTVLQRNQFTESPLCFRPGQTYLRAVQAELKRILKG